MENEANKFIDFIITQKCTYRCKYCSQSKNQTLECNNATKETIQAFYKLLDNIEKDYEITITGGEAILHPDFFEIIEEIKNKGFKINLISNLSFKIETYQKIFNSLKENLNRFDISFHIDEIQNFNIMLEKLEEFILSKPATTKTSFFIPLYNIDTKKELKIDKILRIAKKYNISYSFQKIRFLNNYKEQYSEKYVSHHTKRKTFAKLCFAGCESAVIYENGNAYRCYSSRFNHSNFLGNINDVDFKLNDDAKACTNCSCNCPKPQLYNQICIEKDYLEALKETGKNIINLPKLILKNKEIVIAKIKQFLSF
ncbi:MAG: radical SAM protein [Candidatus Gastranaerophilales bacterium]|nr:radical SAM protein [Candidatus Gastranaerophilales bacterium]